MIHTTHTHIHTHAHCIYVCSKREKYKMASGEDPVSKLEYAS